LAPSERVRYESKLVVMATSLEELEKNGPDQENSRKYLPFGEKIVKIGLVDTEIALLRVKKNKGKNKKLRKVKYIALSASLPSRVKNIVKTYSPPGKHARWVK